MEPVDLSGLKDIHVPVEPDWWPLALGWWLVIAGCFVLILIMMWLFRQWYMTPKQYALRELKGYRRQSKNSVEFAKKVSELLKRVAIFNSSRKKIASMSEEEWFAYLQQKTHQLFSDAQLDLLAKAPYMPISEVSEVPVESLYQVARQTIKLLFRKDKNEHSRKKNK